MKRVVGGFVLAGTMLVWAALPAPANIVWCVDDPPVQTQSPGGQNLTVNTTLYAPKSEAVYVSQAVVTATSSPDGQGGTLIEVDTYLPVGISTATVLAQVKRYHVSAVGSGTGGSTVTLFLDVPTS
jgi:hypothetical protein